MRRYSLFQKFMATVLSLVLIVGLIPTYAAAADSTDITVVSSRVADPNTMNQWKDYFGEDKLSTEFAGGVWTDKSVMTNASGFMEEVAAQITMDDPDNNFLIALSALAANQQVMGYTSAPVDVMLVLDVSGSMDSNGKDTAMIQAANQAIESLLAQNNNNRVGVVLYSGNSSTNQNAGTDTATVILPLDHYTTTSTTTIEQGKTEITIPAYLNLSNNNVSVASGVRNSDEGRVRTGSKSVSGGTYIQNGIYKAWGEFSAVTDVKVPEGNAQAGAQRTPVMVLMSDGQPTLATDSYNQIGTSQRTYGNGSEDSTTWQTVFLTQLTAAWAKGMMQTKYGTTAKFYTLGLGTGNSGYATAVLDPTESNTTLDGYWNNFFDSSKLDEDNNVEIIPNTNNWWENSNAWSVYKDPAVKEQDYVDVYKLAANADEMLAAFKTIVDSIELDAADYVTLVEGEGEDMSGYITFTDEIGIFMEVKDIKGLVMGETLFSGHELAESLQESSMGTQQNPTDYGNEFISTVRERLGIQSVTDAQSLVIAAYADGQLAYDATTGEYSNYIGWYSNDAGDYLGFWDKDTGITAEGAPTGATWINKSYGYLGVAGNSDMMHVIVMLSTHIESGMQVMQYKIPASLIPTVTYKIELEGSDPAKMKSITREDAFPLRLVYEVGLQESINSVNVAQKVQQAIDAGYGHSHIQDDGSYAFYTNKWGHEHEDDEVDYSDPLNHEVAQSHFHPAVGNSRYYYTEDTPVYADTNGTLYTGSAAPSGSGYYRAYHYYTSSGYTTEYLPMSEYALQMAAAKGQQADGYWYIPEGAVFQQIDRFRMEKTENTTGTLEYFDYPVVVDLGDKYETYAFLGNNGKLTIVPAQGIKLTKTVTETVADAQDSFTFDITLSQAVANPLVTDTDGNELTGGWSVSGNVITVTLKAGETVCVTGLPTGVTYTVTERAHADYIGSSTNATGTVEDFTIHAVDFVNIPKGYGNLIISKDVDHPYTTVPEALTNKEFPIQVTLSGEDVANQQFAIAGTDPVEYVTTDANGSFTVKLKDNGSMTVTGLPEGTTFTTTELLDAEVHKGFSMDADRSILSGTIVKDTAVQTHVVNVYAPSSPVATIDVVGTKTLTDEADAFDWNGKSFTIRLEQYDTATGSYVLVDETQVTEGSLSYKFEDKLTFNAIGTYYYKVSEVIPETRLDGMSYDATVGRFEVQVTDNDVDGQLEFVVYDFDSREQIAGTELNYTYTKNFENIHTTDAVATEFTVCKNVEDTHNTGTTGAGYLFELYEVVDGVTAETATYSMRTVLVDGQGQATFHIPVTKAGTRTFILKETAPLEADRIPGMTYDSTQYTVTVTTDSQDGKLLEPVVTVTKDGQSVAMEDLVFTNTINLEPLVLEPYVTKTLIGREPLNDSEFTFNIVQTDGSFATAIQGGYSDTVSVGEGDKYFEKITVTQVGTYYFRTTEVIGNAGGMTYDNSIYHITVNVTAEDGKLVKDVTYVKVGEGVPSEEKDFVQFINTYVNNDTAEVTLSGSKTLTGRSLITGEFSFQLKEGEQVLQTVANRADGSFVFEPITYTAADVGEHTYTVVEVNDGKGGIGYDSTVYTVTVKVEDNGLGELVVTTTGADAIAFNNTYSAEPVNVGFSGTKTWYNTDLGQNKTLTGGEFTFALYATDENYSYQGAQVTSVTNKADGSFSMGLRYTTAGHYYYLLREVVSEDTVTGYDTGVYRIHITVYDNGMGKLIGSVADIYKVGTGADTIAFNNLYTPASGTAVITGQKQLNGHDIADGEFQFQLFEADAQFTPKGEALQTVSNVGNAFSFEEITYDKSGTYYYVVKEVIPEQAVDNVYKGIEYDTTVFGITMNVVDDNGKLGASYSVTLDGAETDLKFVNNYKITNYADVDIVGSKSLLRGTAPIAWGDRVFDFVLLDANDVQLQKVSVDGTSSYGEFTFENVLLTEAKTYTFYVQEVDGGLGGITYDASKYKVTVEVVDDGQGNLVPALPKYWLNDQQVSQIAFTNTYALEKTEAQFRVSKVLENKQLTADMFQFELLDSQDKVLQTKNNLQAGGVLFDAIEYTEPGVYTYTVREVTPEGGFKDGIAYDTHQVTVTVTVTDNGDGTMTADVDYDGLRQFTNTYNVTGEPMFSLSGTKTLTGRDMENGEFIFVLTDAQGDKIEVTNVGTAFSFSNVKLPGLGTHTFTVAEKNTGKNGVTYDGRVYDVSVTVTDDGFGGMVVGTPVVTYHGVAAHLAFTNSYTAQPAKHQLTAEKEYNKTLTGGEFSFTLTGEGQNQTKTNDAKGTVTFDELTFTETGKYEYTVKEIKGNKSYITYDETVYTVMILVEDNGEGQLKVTDVTYLAGEEEKSQLRFTNTYTPASAEYTLTAEKTYTKALLGGEFQFVLTGEGQNQTKTNAADGTVTFDKLTFTEEGEYTYTVKEVKGDKSYITYDDTVYTVTVQVKDNDQGQLVVANVLVSGGSDTVRFENVYVISGNALVHMNGTKTLTGKDLTDGMFTFELYETDSSFTVSGTPAQTVKNQGGIFGFTVEYESEDVGKTFYYVVKEQNAGQTIDGITYSDDSYQVTVQVMDDQTGGLYTVVTADGITGVQAENQTTLEGLSFTNEYRASAAKHQLTATKEYNKTLADGQFEFVLTGNGQNQTKTNDANGLVTFDELTFTEAGTYTYTVSEVKGDKSYITYDDTVYTVTIQVTDNGEGQLEIASVKVDGGDAISFTNTYTPASTEYTLTAEKTYTKELLGGEFQFALTGEGQEQTKTNAAGGAVTFDKLTFDTEGTYTYTVTEVKGDKDYITYDETVYTVTVEVADDNQGKLFVKNVTVSDDKESGNASVKFDNVYVLTGEPVFSIDGAKELTGRDLVDGEFTFVLTDAEGNTVETTNVGAAFAFTNVALPGLGEYVFTLTEKNTGVPTVTYDETVYTVTVTVTDNNEGGMAVSDPVITVNGEAAEPVFHNVYTEPDPITVEFVINKTVTGGDMSAKGFEFVLEYAGQTVDKVTTDDQGKASFGLECPVGSVGTHLFTIREVETGVAYVTYDSTVYTVELTVTENAQGKLEASLKLNGQDVEEISVSFTNHFDPPSTPQTGDSTNVTVLMGTMGFGVLGIIVMLFVLVLDHKKSKFER